MRKSKRFVGLLLAVAILMGSVATAMLTVLADDRFLLDGSEEALLELESGALAGAAETADSISGYSGAGYAVLSAEEDALSFALNVTQAGVYGLSIRSALYMENQSLGKTQSNSRSTRPGTNTVTDENVGTYWASGRPVDADNPHWVQVDLGRVMPIHLARLRLISRWGARTQDVSLLGSTDNEEFTTLSETATRAFSPDEGKTLAGNYADISFPTAQARYVRAVYTGISDTGTDGAQCSEFEIYSPVRTASLYLDGALVSELSMDTQAVTDQDWDTGVLSWLDKEVGELTLTRGEHTLSIRYGGSMPGGLQLDSLTFSLKKVLEDQAVTAVLSLIDALPPLYKITPADAEQIGQAQEAYDQLDSDQQSMIPAASANKLAAAVRRLGLLGEEPAITGMVCHDAGNSAAWSVRTNLQLGEASHGDRTFIFDYIPEELWGCDWIRPAMESKFWSAGDTLVEFDVTADTNLYVGWDRTVELPDWMRKAGFVETDLYLSVNNTDKTQFDLYKKPVKKGEHIQLGYLGKNKATYLVLLEHFTIAEAELPAIEDTAEYPAIADLSVNDTAHQAAWSVETGLAVGDAVYGDQADTFTQIPESLAGSAWIRPAAASGTFAGSDLAACTVNRDGWLYLAVSLEAGSDGWLSDYEKTADTIETSSGAYILYRRCVDAGSRVQLPAQNQDVPCYIPIMQSRAIASSPDRPAISRFMPPWDTNGWYHVRENLSEGSLLYTNADHAVTELPAEYRGCDYIQTYRDEKAAVSFYAERQIEVAITVDSRIQTPSWLLLWEDTGKVLKATGDRTYHIFTNTYPAGSFITLQKLSEESEGDNYTVIFRPLDEGKAATDNPLIPMGEDKEEAAAYQYYANDVFGLEADGGLPDGYRLVSGKAEIAAEGEAVVTDLAYRRPVTYSSATTTQYGNATDGHIDTYWEATADDPNSFLDVDLGRVKAVDSITIKLRDYWGERTQTFSIQGSEDGASYTELVPSEDYRFHPDEKNVLSIPLPAGSAARHIRLCFTGNTGAPGAQVSELQVYGSEISGVNRYLSLRKIGDEVGLLEKAVPEKPAGRLILEYKLRASVPDGELEAGLVNGAGESIAGVLFDRDGYIKAVNGAAYAAVLPYRPNTWYTVKLVVDLETGAYDVWVDHLRKAGNLKTGAAGGAESIRFSADGYEDGDVQLSIDNLRLYDDAEQYLFIEDFTSASGLSGWSFSGTEGRIEGLPFDADPSLAFSAKGTAAKAVRTLPETDGVFTFEAMVQPDGIGFAALPTLTDGENRVAASTAFYHNSLYAANGDNWVKVMDGASPWSYYPAGNWYKIRYVVNTYTKRYDLYVDGALRMEGLSFAEDVSSVSKASFTLGTDNTALVNHMEMYEGRSLAGALDTERVIDVKSAPYGAKGDGVTDDTQAIQLALDDAAYTGATVLLREGVFLTSTLQVRSDTTLYVDESAKILGVMDKYGYPLVQSCDGLINHRQIGRGLILTENASNVRIDGGGVIDGNGFYGYKVNDPAADRRLSDARPSVILSILSEDVTIQNVDLINSAFWTLVPMESRKVTIRNVDVNSMNTPNRDGIDPCDVINCTIENCNILAGDDGLCFKSSAEFGCANIEVRNLMIQSLANGIKFGTDTYDSLQNLTVTDVTMKNVVKSGITIQSMDGAQVDTLSFERVSMTDVDDPIFLTIGDRGRQPVTNPGRRVGYIRNVAFKDIRFTDARMPPYSYDQDIHENILIGLDEDHKIENVSFENVYMEMPGGYTATPGWPNGVGGGYPEHFYIGGKSNAWAYCLKYADNVTFTNCQNVLLKDDARPEITYYDGYSGRPAAYDRPACYVLPTRVEAEIGTPEQELGLPSTVEVVTDLDTVIAVPVEWKAEGGYDPDANGTYTFIGTLGRVSGVYNPDDLKATAKVTVVGQPPLPVITGVQAPAAITVDYGTAFADLPLPEKVTVSLSDGGTDTVVVAWSEEGYDAKTPGDYVLTGSLEAEEGQNPDGWTASIQVTVRDEAAAPIITGVQAPAAITVDYGTAFADLPLPEKVTVSLSDGGTDTVAVAWSEEGYDAKTPGDYVLTGRLEAEEEQNPDGWTASIQVTVRDEAAAPIITGVQTPKDITVDYGTAFADLPLPERVTVSLSDGGTDTVAVVWSEEGYDAKTPGDYVLTGRLEAGEGQNPDGWTVNIRVTVGDRPADNPSLALAQKEAAEILAAYEGNNDTSAQDILSAVQNGLRNADISVEWDRPFALQKATADGDGRITGSLLLSLNGETATVTLDMAIPRLEDGVDPDQSDPEAPSTSDDQPSGPAGSDGAADESATTPAGQPPRTGDTPFAAALSIALCAVGMLGLVAAAGLRSRTRSGRR